MRLVLITGVSGAGRTQAMHFMEDMGYYCMDNLPPVMIPKFIELCSQPSSTIRRVAVVIDIRGGDFFDDLGNTLSILRDAGVQVETLFLDATDASIIKRYKESRRAHPLEKEGRGLKEAIAHERGLLSKLRDRASVVLDTSELSTRVLKEKLQTFFGDMRPVEGLGVTVMSFGYKRGVPLEADLVFDARFLPNPFYIEKLRKFCGQDEPVQEYVFSFPETQQFLDKLLDLMLFLIPYYITEGKNRLVVAIGCTGGMHRSVALSEAFTTALQARAYRVALEHRDLELERVGIEARFGT